MTNGFKTDDAMSNDAGLEMFPLPLSQALFHGLTMDLDPFYVCAAIMRGGLESISR
jgi:hypothetical protein